MNSNRYDIKNKNGHYELFRNGAFIGSYDTVPEAANAIDEDIEERNKESA